MRLLTNDDIQCIYQIVLENDTLEYLNRYVPLPIEKNDKLWDWRDKAFSRVIEVLEFERLVQEYNIQPRKVLVGSLNDPELEYINPEVVVGIDYDAITGMNDLHALDWPEKDFDLVLLGKTLEHLYNPILALERLWEHLVPGGYLFASVPVITIQHSTPFHYYMGFTPVGIGCICEAAGFEVLHIGQWGNIKYTNKVFCTKTWPDYRIPEELLRNEFENPASAWVLARRSI